MDFRNVYEDAQRAAAYATLEFPGTYYLAFRDLPAIIARDVPGGRKAIDFGCGTGRSTRFLKGLGFETVGVDISEDMLRLARERDPEGDYRRLDSEGLRTLGVGEWDLVLSAFTFDNIPPAEKMTIFGSLRDALGPEGRIVNLVSSAELYRHDWASFECASFAENHRARRGDAVYTIMKDVPDPRPVHDFLWPDDAYRETYAQAGLEMDAVYRPLGHGGDPCQWVNEERIAPWTIYVLGKPRTA